MCINTYSEIQLKYSNVDSTLEMQIGGKLFHAEAV